MTIKQEELGLFNWLSVTASTRPCAERVSTEHGVCEASDSGTQASSQAVGQRAIACFPTEHRDTLVL